MGSSISPPFPHNEVALSTLSNFSDLEFLLAEVMWKHATKDLDCRCNGFLIYLRNDVESATEGNDHFHLHPRVWATSVIQGGGLCIPIPPDNERYQ